MYRIEMSAIKLGYEKSFQVYYCGTKCSVLEKCEIGNITNLLLHDGSKKIGYRKEFNTKPIYTVYAILGDEI